MVLAKVMTPQKHSMDKESSISSQGDFCKDQLPFYIDFAGSCSTRGNSDLRLNFTFQKWWVHSGFRSTNYPRICDCINDENR